MNRRKPILLVCLFGLIFFGIMVFYVKATTEWIQQYPLGFDAHIRSVAQTDDGGYILAGHNRLNNATASKALLVKTDSSGKIQWYRSYGAGGKFTDEAHSVLQTSDGGYAAAGVSWSSNTTGHFWVFKVDVSGKMLWNRTDGGNYNTNAWALIKTNDGGYAGAGFSTNILKGDSDFFLVKIDASGKTLWRQVYGTPGNDVAFSVIQTKDGGYALTGRQNGHQLWLVKTYASGDIQWNQTYGGAGTDVANSMIKTSDGGYLLGGNTESFGLKSAALLIIKTDSKGLSPPAVSNPETTVWVPQPTNAVEATVAATIVTGGVSIIAVAAVSTPGLPISKFAQRIQDHLPDVVKNWLAAFMSSKRKLAVDEKTNSPFLPTKSEFVVYVVSIIVLGFSFSYVKVDSLSQILSVLPTILSTSILVGFGKTFIMIAYSRIRGVWTEYKLWYLGLATFLFTTFAFRVPFSSPSRSVHYEPKLTKQLSVNLSLAEVLLSLVFAGGFYALLKGGFNAVGSIGLAMCLIGAFFDTLPIKPMNGKTIYDYNRLLWMVLFVATLGLYASWIFLIE